jgi:NADP-dependent 3-hydroxy acid dehydrogenase YdfG
MRTSFFDEREERYKPTPDARLCDPADVAGAILAALDMPRACEMRELVITGRQEASWP